MEREGGAKVIEQLVKQCAYELIKRGHKKVLPTHLMWHLMNEIDDSDLYEWDLTIVDIAEKVVKYCENCQN